jgi:hypothetical protein
MNPRLNRRQILQLTGAATVAAAAGAAIDTGSAEAAVPAAAGGLGPIGIVSRAPDLMDAFAVGVDGGVYTAAWQPGDTAFRGWWRVGGLEAAPCSPVSAVSRSLNKMDVFTTGLDGRVYTAAWQPGDTAFRGWWPVGGLVTVPHGVVTAVSRSTDKLDVFAVGLDGFVYTAAWQPGDSGFRGWWRIGSIQAPPGAQVSVVSRSTDKMDIFVTATDNRVYTAAWQPGDSAFRGWWPVAGGMAAPGAPVTAVSRSTDKMDVFVVGLDNFVYTAAWQPGDSGFRGWWRVGNIQAKPRTVVYPVSRSTDKMDVFMSGVEGNIYTAAWQPGDSAFRGWWPVAGGWTNPGTTVSAVSRSTDLLDVFVAGGDARVYTAAWRPGDSGFRGWWVVSNLLTGMSDPGVSQWTNVGTAYQSVNTDWSEEAQGITTDGGFWYLVSNGNKTIRKMNDGAGLIAVATIPQGAGDGHVGAPGYYDGWVYVPVQTPYGVWRIRSDFSRSEWHPVDTTDNRLSWCSVNPQNGRLYTSMYDAAGSAVLFAYDRDTLQRRPEDDFTVSGGPVWLDKIQGGVFTPRGRVILVRSDPNAVFCYSSLTGYCFGSIGLGDYGSLGSEVESVTVRPWSFNGTPASVHILELDNDRLFIDPDDCYLHSYSVPQPQRL